MESDTVSDTAGDTQSDTVSDTEKEYLIMYYSFVRNQKLLKRLEII